MPWTCGDKDALKQLPSDRLSEIWKIPSSSPQLCWSSWLRELGQTCSNPRNGMCQCGRCASATRWRNCPGSTTGSWRVGLHRVNPVHIGVLQPFRCSSSYLCNCWMKFCLSLQMDHSHFHCFDQRQPARADAEFSTNIAEVIINPCLSAIEDPSDLPGRFANGTPLQDFLLFGREVRGDSRCLRVVVGLGGRCFRSELGWACSVHGWSPGVGAPWKAVSNSRTHL